MSRSAAGIDAMDRAIIVETQHGLPLTPRPYHTIAARLGIDPEELMRRLQRMLDCGIIRRIALVPNHFRLGYQANAMSVWDVPDEEIQRLGMRVGRLDFVSHCYHRPRILPDWPYNLFAMVHGHDRKEVEAKVEQIAAILEPHHRGYELLYSKRILKKTGLRLKTGRGP